MNAKSKHVLRKYLKPIISESAMMYNEDLLVLVGSVRGVQGVSDAELKDLDYFELS